MIFRKPGERYERADRPQAIADKSPLGIGMYCVGHAWLPGARLQP